MKLKAENYIQKKQINNFYGRLWLKFSQYLASNIFIRNWKTLLCLSYLHTMWIYFLVLVIFSAQSWLSLCSQNVVHQINWLLFILFHVYCSSHLWRSVLEFKSFHGINFTLTVWKCNMNVQISGDALLTISAHFSH